MGSRVRWQKLGKTEYHAVVWWDRPYTGKGSASPCITFHVWSVNEEWGWVVRFGEEIENGDGCRSSEEAKKEAIKWGKALICSHSLKVKKLLHKLGEKHE